MIQETYTAVDLRKRADVLQRDTLPMHQLLKSITQECYEIVSQNPFRGSQEFHSVRFGQNPEMQERVSAALRNMGFIVKDHGDNPQSTGSYKRYKVVWSDEV